MFNDGGCIVYADSNECEEGTSDCFDNSMCTDTALAFECRCPEGFIDLDGDGRNCIGMFYFMPEI